MSLLFVSIEWPCCSFQIDLQTFLTLTDQDLKELGITTFGARRKMLLAISGTNNQVLFISRVFLFARIAPLSLLQPAEIDLMKDLHVGTPPWPQSLVLSEVGPRTLACVFLWHFPSFLFSPQDSVKRSRCRSQEASCPLSASGLEALGGPS